MEHRVNLLYPQNPQDMGSRKHANESRWFPPSKTNPKHQPPQRAYAKIILQNSQLKSKWFPTLKVEKYNILVLPNSLNPHQTTMFRKR